MALIRLIGTLAAGAALAFALPAGAAEKPRVLATVGMLADVAANVGGDCVAVTAMMGPGTDPHLYQASAGDVRTLFAADAILYVGHNLEGQLGEVFASVAERKPTRAVAEAAIPTGELILPESADYADPHVWMDARLWARTAEVVAGELAALVPGCADAIRARADAYAAELEALDDWVRASVASIPDRQRVLVTAHDAFAYYGRAYGIEVAGIQGISTESEAGIADIRATVDLVVAREVPAVFIESTISPRTVNAVIEAANQRGHEVALGPELYSDAMGEAGTAAGTYIGMIHANTMAIVSALGGRPLPLPGELVAWAERWQVPTGG
ncbi:MAG TPA: zinc ABC transporter substrate-binding protein [Thermohalobaculum sp.]|nr:zinc ABC transporter substrate-binding protein [Thermohalobaculum sp.]